jgi:hypothetical protein
VVPRTGLDDVEKRKFVSHRGSNSDPSVFHPVASRYTDYAIVAYIHLQGRNFDSYLRDYEAPYSRRQVLMNLVLGICHPLNAPAASSEVLTVNTSFHEWLDL